MTRIDYILIMFVLYFSFGYMFCKIGELKYKNLRMLLVLPMVLYLIFIIRMSSMAQLF